MPLRNGGVHAPAREAGRHEVGQLDGKMLYPWKDYHLDLVVRFAEHQSESKNKRKRVVDQVNKWLDKNDTLLTKIEEVFEKFQK